MGNESHDFSDIAAGVSPAFVETMYAKFRSQPDAVEPGWREFFEGLEGSAQGPSWGRAGWPLKTTDDLTAALDPTQMEAAAKPAKGGAPAAKAAPASEADVVKAANDSIRAMTLIRTYRVRGHLAAKLDPLGIMQHELPDDL